MRQAVNYEHWSDRRLHDVSTRECNAEIFHDRKHHTRHKQTFECATSKYTTTEHKTFQILCVRKYLYHRKINMITFMTSTAQIRISTISSHTFDTFTRRREDFIIAYDAIMGKLTLTITTIIVLPSRCSLDSRFIALLTPNLSQINPQ